MRRMSPPTLDGESVKCREGWFRAVAEFRMVGGSTTLQARMAAGMKCEPSGALPRHIDYMAANTMLTDTGFHTH